MTKNSHEIFNQIANKYDTLNHILSFGSDTYWRKVFVKKIPKRKYNNVVDLASGTGDMLLKLKKLKAKNYYAIDPAKKMLNIARQKFPDAVFLNNCAEDIPLVNDFSDLISIAFGIRNFSNPDKALKEIFRILKPGGILAIMEFERPAKSLISAPILYYFDHIMPYIGKKISGHSSAYLYLKDSVNSFTLNYNISNKMESEGFKVINKYKMLFGVVRIYIAEKLF